MNVAKLIFSCVAIATCLFAAQILSAAQTAVPIEKEPMHRLKFENEFVRVFDVLIPAGKASLIHTHVYDGVGVRVSDAEMIDEVTGAEKKPFVAKWGGATFGSGPSFSHKVVNRGTTDFHNIYVELLPQKEAGSAPGVLPVLSNGHMIVIDNPRVRVNRLVLKPGESSLLHTHTRNGLGIIVYDAKIEIVGPGGSLRQLDAKAGDFVWQKAGTTHVIKNIGTTVFEAIDIELK
jgi:mannose-6-phosphate isomerase-like protein (cupin superfamily)